MIRLLTGVAVWAVALASIPARDLLFGGQIHVWPFILASCALAAVYNWPVAALLAGAVISDQIIQRLTGDPVVPQFALYSIAAFVGWRFIGWVPAVTAALVSLLYLSVPLGADWRLAMIISEVVIVCGLCAGIINAGSSDGGIRRNTGPRHEALQPIRVAAPPVRGAGPVVSLEKSGDGPPVGDGTLPEG